MYNNQFVIHTTYHSGTEYISCPWSYRPSQCPDYDHIIQLAGVYSSSSGYANLTYGPGCTGMYQINGSSKDSNYGIQGSISWSMEISYSKHPPASQIMMYYNYNYPSMITMIEYSGYGLEGTVTDVNTGNPVTAVVFVNDYFPTYTDPTCGDYHKYVLPGTYSITIVANGYQTQTIDNIVVTANSATSTDFQLLPEDKQYVFKLSASQIPDNNNADEGNTPAVIGAPDNINYSIGKYGWCVLDMQYPVIDGPGFDIIVYEGDATPEIYTCYIGETIDGPWISLGAGNGTTEFDISNSGLPEAQFIKILDDGDGSANVADAGFDLDAIEALPPVSGIYLAMYEYVIDDSNGNNNGKIDPGETVDLIVTLKNNGDLLAENIQGEISTSSAFLTMLTDTASFGTLAQGQTGEGIFTVTAQANTPPGEPAEINLDVTSNGGTYNNSFIMNFVIGQIPVVIIDLDENHNSASEIKSAIETNGISVESLTSFPAAVDVYSTIFVCLGIYSDNHVLTSGEGQMLADFLNNGGNLYMEGGDTWYYDDQTAVHPMFNINAESDGSSDLSTIAGQPGTFTEGMSFSYSGDNSWIDHISPISPAMLILENQSPVYGTGVAHDAGIYKTIGASHEFGGLADGSSPSTKEELVAAYLEFFGIGTSLQAAFTSSTTEICEQEIIDFTDMSTGDVVTWEWEFEGGSPATSSFQNPTVAYFNEGIFDVTLTVSDGVESNTITLENYITVMSTPEIPATPEGPTSVVSYPGEISDYATMGSVNANTYTWNIEPAGAGTLIENDTSCSVDWTDYWEGTAYLKVKAINECGESDFSESLEISCYISDIANISNNEIQIIPNPNDGRFTIHLGAIQPDKSELKILDNLGKIVYIKRLKSLENSLLKLNLEELNSGVYFLILNTETSIIKEKIIIK
jgi:PKD repeat protein